MFTYDELMAKLESFIKSEKELSNAYLRIRRLIGAYDTKPGGVDRFEVTEKRILELLAAEEILNEIKRIAEEWKGE